MTIEEAKKIIEMCADAVKKGDGEDAKIYVNKEYVLSILDMVERTPQITWPDDPYPYPWYPTQPGPYNPLDPGVTWKDRFIYKKTTDGTGDDAPGKWVPTPEPPKPWEPWCNTTGQPPAEPDIHVFATHDTSMNDNDSVTTGINGTTPTHQYKEEFTTTGPIKETTDGTHTI